MGGRPTTPIRAHVVLDNREHVLIERLAQASGKTPDEIRNEARRRALRIEMESMRRIR